MDGAKLITTPQRPRTLPLATLLSSLYFSSSSSSYTACAVSHEACRRSVLAALPLLPRANVIQTTKLIWRFIRSSTALSVDAPKTSPTSTALRVNWIVSSASISYPPHRPPFMNILNAHETGASMYRKLLFLRRRLWGARLS